jgi:3-oxoacyl-[acyl-carrier-protein] synthase II
MKLSITGMGVVSPAGVGKEIFYESLTNGRTGIDIYTADPLIRKAGIVKDFDVRLYTKKYKQVRSLAAVTHYAIAASKMAAEEGRFSSRATDPYISGIITGCNYQADDNHTHSIIRAYEKSLAENGEIDSLKLMQNGLLEIPALYLLTAVPNIPSFACSFELSLHGYCSTIISGSNSFFETLIEADIAMGRNMADSIFCGSTDSLISPIDIMTIVPPDATTADDCAETIPGEGSVFFLIDDTQIAEKNQWNIYADIVSCTGNLFHGCEDIEKNIERSLCQANLAAADIDAIVVSEGTGRVLSKPALESIAGCFTQKTSSIPISSPLPYVGYTRAAAGAFDLAFGIFMVETGKIPPMLQPVDTSCCAPLFCDKEFSIEKDCRTVLVINIGLAGCVYSAILRKRER